MYEGKYRIINNRVDEDLCMQKLMKFQCRIKFYRTKTAFRQIERNFSENISQKKHSSCYKIFLI